MASASTINYNFGGYLQSVPTLAALRSTTTSSTLKKGDTIQVTASVVNDDHGGGDFVWVPTETSADDGVLIIRPNDIAVNGPGRWVLFGQAKALELEIGLQELDAIVYDPVLGNVALHASYETEIILRASGDSALSERIDQINATVTDDFATLGAEITNVQTAFASTTEAQAQTIQTLTATVNTNASNTLAAIENEQTARATSDSAATSRMDSMTSEYRGLNSTTNATITSTATTLANADQAATSRMDSMTSEYQSLNATTNATITTTATTLANATGALANRVTTLEADDSNTGLSARVTTVENAVSSLDGKTAAYWSVESVAGNNRAQLTVHADANGGAGVDIVGDLTIHGNLIVDGTVTTDTLANGSVSARYATILGSPITGAGDSTYLVGCQYTFTLTHQATVIAQASASQNYYSGQPDWGCYLDYDGNIFGNGASGGANTYTSSWALTGLTTLPAGQHTITLYWRGGGSQIKLTAAGLVIDATYK